MAIKKLPQHIINRLKAWEIVERPSAILKELMENAFDADATKVAVTIEKWWKKYIAVEDNWVWIPYEDIQLSIERYATSKITTDYDLERIDTYWFRGEALASISEVASVRIQTRHCESTFPEWVGHALWKDSDVYTIDSIPVWYTQGTKVSVADLFQLIPARLKFLKSDNTERNYCKQVFLSFAIIHRDKALSLSHNGKTVFDCKKEESLMARLESLYTADWQWKRKVVERSDDTLHIYWVVWDASLHFPAQQYIQVFVNNRPVQDKLIKKAIMDAYEKQIVLGTFPFAHLFIQISPWLVDVNVHPRKSEVKFLDPGSIYNRIKETIRSHLWNEKVNYAAFTKHHISHTYWSSPAKSWSWHKQWVFQRWEQTAWPTQAWLVWFHWWESGNHQEEKLSTQQQIYFGDDPVRILGQLWDSYIIAAWKENIYYIDQHALAERIAFEKIKKQVAREGFSMDVLLTPLSVSYPRHVDIENVIDILWKIWFDCALFWEQKVIFYAIPQIFATYSVDIEALLQWVWWHTEQLIELQQDPQSLFVLLLDEIIGMKACKLSIKAWQHLHYTQMHQLLLDWLQCIDWQFVCQHGRPSVVRIEKKYVDALFDR